MRLSLVDALELFFDMNEFVISLDRISSRITWGADPQLLLDYIADRDVFQRLAKARGILGAAVESVIGEETLEEIAETVYCYPDRQ